MTPREHKEFEEEQKQIAIEKSRDWFVSLKRSQGTGYSKKFNLSDCLESMKDFKLKQSDIPLIIKLAENPKYFTSRLFTGAVDLFTHDCIHALLGRGLLPKDEAFVIGYTMGSEKRMSNFKRVLFLFACRYLYPEGYRFYKEERLVFNKALQMGRECPTDLTEVDFKNHLERPLSEIRAELGIDTEAINKYYQEEKELFPNSKESQRLL
jgi:hypothetical protein